MSPTHATLLFSAEDGIDLSDLIVALEGLRSMHYGGDLPGHVVGLSMNDHHLKIELDR